jgi:hypothetical protein
LLHFQSISETSRSESRFLYSWMELGEICSVLSWAYPDLKNIIIIFDLPPRLLGYGGHLEFWPPNSSPHENHLQSSSNYSRWWPHKTFMEVFSALPLHINNQSVPAFRSSNCSRVSTNQNALHIPIDQLIITLYIMYIIRSFPYENIDSEWCHVYYNFSNVDAMHFVVICGTCTNSHSESDRRNLAREKK